MTDVSTLLVEILSLERKCIKFGFCLWKLVTNYSWKIVPFGRGVGGGRWNQESWISDLGSCWEQSTLISWKFRKTHFWFLTAYILASTLNRISLVLRTAVYLHCFKIGGGGGRAWPIWACWVNASNCLRKQLNNFFFVFFLFLFSYIDGVLLRNTVFCLNTWSKKVMSN